MSIQINLLRISPDSNYIEFSVECPTDYLFNVLKLKRYDYESVTGYPTNANGWVDASAVYKQTSTKEVIRIATSIFKGSSMYYVEFGVKWNGSGSEPVSSDGTKLSDSNVIGVCSDINNIYEYILCPILSIDTEACAKVNDETRRAFVFLFAHIEAMRLERFDEAEQFYDILKNNFSVCDVASRYKSSFNCNCNG